MQRSERDTIRYELDILIKNITASHSDTDISLHLHSLHGLHGLSTSRYKEQTDRVTAVVLLLLGVTVHPLGRSQLWMPSPAALTRRAACKERGCRLPPVWRPGCVCGAPRAVSGSQAQGSVMPGGEGNVASETEKRVSPPLLFRSPVCSTSSHITAVSPL
jgi:hypothetical protein